MLWEMAVGKWSLPAGVDGEVGDERERLVKNLLIC